MQSTRHFFAILFLLFCSTQAYATTVKVTGWSSYTSSSYTYTAGTFTETGDWAGMINYTVDGYSTFGFCIDIPQTIGKKNYNNNEYQLVDLDKLTQLDGKGVERNNLLNAAWLIDTFASSATSKQSKAALQLAIWETVYADHFTLNSANSTVQEHLDAVNTAIPFTDTSFAANYRVLYSSTNQDQLIYYPVPEPSTIVLLLSGLIGLLFIVRRRNKV